jgi:hypothetical protein
MARLGKYLSLSLVIIIAVSSIPLVVKASVGPTPTVPRFSLSYYPNTIEVTISNQPTYDSVYFDIRFKEHSVDTWTYFYPKSELFQGSRTQATVVTYGINGNKDANVQIYGVSAGDQIDFQVEALTGHYLSSLPNPSNPMRSPDEKFHYVFDGTGSGYSSTQTITIPGHNTLSPGPTVPEFPITASLVTILATVSLLLILGKRKHTFEFVH